MKKWKSATRDGTPVEALPIPGFEGYFATTCGKIFSSKHSWRELKQQLTTKGYLYVTVFTNSMPRYQAVHRLVMLAHAPIDPDRKFVDHINGIKTDNRIENLRWASHKENMRYFAETGAAAGDNNPRAKLTNNQVRKIKGLLNDGVYAKDIASQFGVSVYTINEISSGKRWNHVAEPERIVFEDVTFEDTPNASCAILRGVQYRQLQGKRGRLEFVVEDEERLFDYIAKLEAVAEAARDVMTERPAVYMGPLIDALTALEETKK